MPREGARPTSLSAVAAVRRSRPTSRTFELPNRRTLPPFRLASATEEQPPRVIRYLYDGQAILATFTETGKERARYTSGPGIDEPLAELHRKQLTFYHADGLGSILALTDAQGRSLRQYHYEAFGLPEEARSDRQPFRFTGREWDKEIGLYYYRARYYDPKAGRFASEDPIGFAGGGSNLYRFVRGNPLSLTDPLGLADLNLFAPADPVYRGAAAAPSPPNTYTVAGHGNPYLIISAQGTPLTAAQLANMIRSDPKYKPGMTVQLMSCNVGVSPAAGQDPFAQQVSNALGVTVQGANNFVWYYENGQTVVAPTKAPGITWQNYTPAAGATGPNLNLIGGYNSFAPAH